MRKIAIYDSFTEPKHRRLIDETAARAGFTVDYYAAPAAVPADKRGDYEVIYGMPKPGELKDFVNLKWFCGSFAGVDAYLDDSLYPSPEVMLSNSSGAYGVTIAEHMVMVTLMLLRHAPAYCADQAAGRWGRVLPMRSIMGSTITIVGTGDIGTEFARRAKAMGAAAVRGVRRTKRPPTPPLTRSIPTTSWTPSCRIRISWPWPCPPPVRRRGFSPRRASLCCRRPPMWSTWAAAALSTRPPFWTP